MHLRHSVRSLPPALRLANQVKNTGTKIVAMNVAKSMPPHTPVPMERRALAPAPVANTAVLFATTYDVNADLAAKGVFITTLFSLITVPLTVMIVM